MTVEHNPKITVFTPTFNREKTLYRLYKSLLHQSIKDFEWLVVDDGSTDDTASLIKQFQKDNKINIRYIKQVNKGKHKAINKGLDHAKGKFFLTVDSDDYLTTNAIEVILKHLTRIDYNINGIVFRKGYTEDNFIGSSFPKGTKSFVSDLSERVYKYKVKGDMLEVIKTDILRMCKFDEDIDEKFCAEGLMWNRTVKLGLKCLFINKIIYIAEYLPDGLSANTISNRRNSAKYTSLLYLEHIELSNISVRNRLKSYINYWRFSYFNGLSFFDNYKRLNNKLYAFLTILPGYLLRKKDDFTLKNN